MKVLITGAGGQLAHALVASAPRAVPLAVTLRAFTHAELDIADLRAVEAALQELRPALVINAAGYTRVDDAETEHIAAQRANATGPAVLAGACARAGAWLVHVSTDYVFDGEQCTPYDPAAKPNPLSIYGRTKLDGEHAVIRELPEHSTIVRASWLYAARGRNFLTTMLHLMRVRPQLAVVADQIGAPTHATGLARALWALGARRAGGLYHWCDSGVASWYDFAVAIAEEALALGVLTSAPSIDPIPGADYPTTARRPRSSLLDKRATEVLLGWRAPHWRAALRETLLEVRAAPALAPHTTVAPSP
jgi:dTDP-4-dehydrorhamnose reductase